MLYTNLARKTTFVEPILFGWGMNKNFDLGINTGSNVVAIPNNLDIVLNDPTDYVVYG